jgi:hypothetical protein
MSTAALQVALESLTARVDAAARAGSPLRQRQAVELLRRSGLGRDEARRVLATTGVGRWVVTRGETTPRGGRRPTLLVPVDAGVSGIWGPPKRGLTQPTNLCTSARGSRRRRSGFTGGGSTSATGV